MVSPDSAPRAVPPRVKATLVTTRPGLLPPSPPHRIFCNRTLNLRAIEAIGYDMDYTLIHYRIDEWERRSYEYLQEKLASLWGWDIGDLAFDPKFVIRGLCLDVDAGNIVKPNRFGYVKRACHGTRFLTHEEQRQQYSRTVVDLSDRRWVFLNTFFSLSEACLFAQLVDRLDAGLLGDALGYADLYRRIVKSLDEAHMEGQLKAEIVADPARFVDVDPDLPQALLDQKKAGKKLLLITNSEWVYTRDIMTYCFDGFLPGEMTWRDLFEVIIVFARKPEFFSGRPPLFRVVDEEGRLEPVVSGIQPGERYLGGNADLVEASLGLDGSSVLYVGDHIYSDVHVSKSIRRWRTAVVVRELEDELRAMTEFRAREQKLEALMNQKVALEEENARTRLARQRCREDAKRREIAADLDRQAVEIKELDRQIGPLARAASELHNPHWGLLMRTGNDKSHFARQVEAHADIYTSRVSNFLHATPYALFRSHRGSLPHDDSIDDDSGGDDPFENA